MLREEDAAVIGDRLPDVRKAIHHLTHRQFFCISAERASAVRRVLENPALRSIVARAGSQAEVELKGGERWVVRASGGGELSAGTRILVEGSDGREVEVPFRRIERIDFRGEDGPGPDGQRLFGTVRSSAGTFRGPMLWDADESTLDAVLDGETGGQERDVTFRRCGRCEAQSWETADGPIPLTHVLDLARTR